MKKLNHILLGFFLMLMNLGISQTYNMSSGTTNTCSGTFYDSGGLGLYANNSNLNQTFCSNSPGSLIRVNFSAFQTEANLDVLRIYDGPTTASPLIGSYSGVGTLNGVTITSSTGCLTFNFISDGSVNYNGWTSTFNCTYACQPFTAVADSLSPSPDTSAQQILQICNGSTVNMFGDADYPSSGTYYGQNNSTSTFSWRIGDGTIVPGQNASHTFNSPGVFDITLEVIDTIGCVSRQRGARVYVSGAPNFRKAVILPNDTICFGDTALIVVTDSGLFTPFTPPVLNAAGVTFLPDGSGLSYRDTIPVSIFSPTATFQNGFLDGIYVNMEHSYLGDLEIRLTCPNNTTVILKEYPNGGGTFLGEPVDPAGGTPLNPGIGYTYEFTHLNPTYGTMVSEAGNYTYNYTDVLGNNYVNQNYLPAGTYSSFQNLRTTLAGCPMNGNWIITVTDNLLVDNGYIFFWGLNFDTTIRPPANATAPILASRDSSTWFGGTTLSTPGDTSALVSPILSGSHQYTYRIYDNFGCIHDTLLEVYVKPKLTSNAGPDFTTCRLDYQLNGVQIPGASESTWQYYSVSATGNSLISDTSIYNPTTNVNEYSPFYYILEETIDGCQTYPDTAMITHTQVQNTIDISVNDDTLCLPQLVTFTNNSDMTSFDSIYWSFGDGNSSNTQGTASHNYTFEGCYDLKVTLVNTLGCKVDSVLPNLVCAYPTPVASFSSNPFEPIVPETEIFFTNQTSGATTYLWDFAGLGTSILTDDFFEFPKTDGGKYPVTLSATNEGGCFDQITKIITIKNPLSYWIPSAFTPNDDGVNDEFRVVFNNSSSVTEYTFFIFNKWGEVIFSSTDPDEIWDGKYKGVLVQADTYVFKIIGKEEFEIDGFVKYGHITVIR